ncbi:hypothetical protein LAW66_22315 [Escherichia coli]|nr:hypothetical protein [Escherichia coli]
MCSLLLCIVSAGWRG